MRKICASQLQVYFASGWAFLIPYLLAYLLYSWLRWPANTFAGNSALQESISRSGPSPSILHFLAPPPLLHVFWALHAIHVILAVCAFQCWWNRNEIDRSGVSQSANRFMDRMLRILPWLMLTLAFAVPGTYLEWPSDPWEHLRRITEWKTLAIAGGHSAGYKALYFFPYSFVGRIPAMHQLAWLNVYYTGMCLLVAWQYYLLAKATGFDRLWAFLYVAVNLLTFGNSTFSFYRYYGLATTMFSQLAAVALTRLVLRYAGAHVAQQMNPRERPPAGKMHRTGNGVFLSQGIFRFLRLIGESVPLLLLIAFSHFEGFGIAALGIAAIIIWRLVDWRRSMLMWLILFAAAASVAILAWYPQSPFLKDEYRPSGWLNGIYGLNIFQWPSPAADRVLQILGAFGVANLIAAIVLLRRNHVAAWLTILPVIALALPIGGIPLANFFASTEPQDILAFHRVLFAIPSGLALLVLIRGMGAFSIPAAWPAWLPRPMSPSAFTLLLLALCFATTIPATPPYYNRAWQFLQCVPDDLSLVNAWQKIATTSQYLPAPTDNASLITTSIPGFLVDVQRAGRASKASRLYLHHATSPATDIVADEELLRKHFAQRQSCTLLFGYAGFYSTSSFAGFCSGHWLPREVQLAAAGTPELNALVGSSGTTFVILPGAVLLYTGK